MSSILLIILLTRIIISLGFISSPLSIGVWIIMLALAISTSLSIQIPSWFSLLIFLIYVGGLLVMFSYFVAIQPNQQLGFIKIVIIATITLLYLTIATIYYPTTTVSHTLLTFSCSFIISSTNMILIFLLGLLLFFALITVVKITFSSKAPLRPFSYVFTNTKIPSCSENYK